MFKKKTILFIFIALFAVLFTAIFTFNVSAALEDELAADKAKSGFIPNGDFSNTDISSDFRGSFILKEGEGIGGGNAVEVEQGSALYYVMKDLQPNTVYTFSAYFKTVDFDGGDPPCIVIKGWGGDDIYAPTFKEAEYMRAEHSFMSGDEVRAEVEFHVWNVTSGPIMVDSIFLYLYEAPAPEPTDPLTEAPAEPENADDAAADVENTAAQQGQDSSDSSDSESSNNIIIIIIAAAVVLAAVIIIVIATRKKK